MNEGRKFNRWYRNFHRLIGYHRIDQPTVVWEDNESAINLCGEGTFHKRSKHFGLEWYATKEAKDRGEIDPGFVETKDQLADWMTKCLPIQQFLEFRDAIMGSKEYQEWFRGSRR